MTATTPASQVIPKWVRTGCPSWCTSPDAAVEHLHSRDLAETWGATSRPYGESKLGLALEAEDGDGESCEPRINVQFSADGVLVDGSAALRLSTAESYAYAILRLVAEGRDIA